MPEQAQVIAPSMPAATLSPSPAGSESGTTATSVVPTPLWFELAGKLGAAFAWPLTILILCIVFRQGLRACLVALEGFINRLKRVGWGGAWVDSGEVGAPTPPAQEPPRPGTLSPQATELLSTLWKHHLSHLGRDFSRRWTFILSPGAPRYGDYLKGLADAFHAGLVTVSPQNLHCLLTDAGVRYCQANESQLSGDFWVPSSWS